MKNFDKNIRRKEQERRDLNYHLSSDTLERRKNPDRRSFFWTYYIPLRCPYRKPVQPGTGR